MSKTLLFLYDLKEKDLVRDLRSFLETLGVENINMIPLEESQGLSLEEKEKHNFKGAFAALFLITPGSQRDGKWYPSPSVSVEVGIAKKQFEKFPQRVFYLVSSNCEISAVDQKCRISFSNGDARSIIEALTLLIKEMRMAGVVPPIQNLEKQIQQTFDFATFFHGLGDQLRGIVFDVAEFPNGTVLDFEFRKILQGQYGLDARSINFVLQDLQRSQLVTYQNPYWFLASLGWSVAKTEAKRRQEIGQKTAESLARLISDLRDGKGLLGQPQGLLGYPPVTGPKL